MLYSCFHDQLRLYEVFEDDRRHPMNGDLPVPTLGSPVNGIGVPASEAGRTLPSDAKRIGTSWHARGLVVQCNKTPVRGLSGPEMTTLGAVAIIVGPGAVGSVVGYKLGGGLGAVAGGVLGIVATRLWLLRFPVLAAGAVELMKSGKL